MADVIINCAQHPRFTCCIVQFDGEHVPGRACTCLIVHGAFVVSPDCPLDEHRAKWLATHAEW